MAAQPTINVQKKQYGWKIVSAAATLTPADRKVEIVGVGSNFTVTLPPVKEAEEMVPYVFRMTARGSSETITLADGGDDSVWSNLSFNAVADWLVLISDGEHWLNIAANSVS